MVTPWVGRGPFRGRGPFKGRGPFAGQGSPFGRLTGSVWTPARLFASSEVGAWYDPSDLTTLFQDAAGTTPVTAVEQPVGLMLDKSRGLVLGNERVGATWLGLDATWTQSGSTLIAVNGTSFTIYQPIVPAGSYYQISFEIFDYVAGSLTIRVGNSGVVSATYNANGTYTVTALASGDGYFYWMGGGTFTGKIRNISVRQLPGNHASQSTTTSRPVLSARVNLLTQTEDFSQAVWVKAPSGAVATITTNTAVAPDNTTTADTLTCAASNNFVAVRRSPAGLTASAEHVFSVYAKPGTSNWLNLRFWDSGANGINAWFNVSTGIVGTVQTGCTATIQPAANGYYRCIVRRTIASSIAFNEIDIGVTDADNSYAATTGATVVIWGADLRVANDGAGIPAYQRVTTSTDYDTVGFPRYLKFETDDSLSTASINFSSTDKMSVFAGVRKASDANVGQLIELSDAVTNFGNTGSFSMPASDGGATWVAAVRGSGSAVTATATGLAAPITTVNTSLMDLSLATGDVRLRINAVQQSASTSDTGGGNFGNYPLFIGRRNNATLPFNGRLFSLIVLGRSVSATELSAAESWVAGKTGVTL